MKTKLLIFVICILWLLPISLLAEKSIILTQENAPLKITEYKVQYGLYNRQKVISHSVKFLNISDKQIVAIRIGFISFTVFNEFLHKFTGFGLANLSPNGEDKGIWNDNHYKSFLFQNYGTGLAYVDAARFEDGTIWKVNEADILPQIQEIEESFTADLLKEKKEK